MLTLKELKTIKTVCDVRTAFGELPKYIFDSLEEEWIIPNLEDTLWYHIGEIELHNDDYNEDEEYFEFSFEVYLQEGYSDMSYSMSYVQLRYDKKNSKWEVHRYEDMYDDYDDKILWQELFFNKRKIV